LRIDSVPLFLKRRMRPGPARGGLRAELGPPRPRRPARARLARGDAAVLHCHCLALAALA
jgi:hypothetical protein